MPAQELDREDYEYDIVSELYDGVTEHRGLGRSGREVRIVEKECPTCSHDRMIQIIRVSPEQKDAFTYKCQSPTCPRFHNGSIPGLARY